MINRPSSRVRAFAVGFIAVLVPAAICAAQIDYQNPGYQWGRQNCGPRTSSNRTYSQCKTCCSAGRYNHRYPADDHASCLHFCLRAF